MLLTHQDYKYNIWLRYLFSNNGCCKETCKLNSQAEQTFEELFSLDRRLFSNEQIFNHNNIIQ